MRTKQTVSFQADETGGSRVGQAAAGGAGLDDLAVEGEAVDDRGAESRVGEGLRPAGERFVGGDRDGRLLLGVIAESCHEAGLPLLTAVIYGKTT